MLWPEAKLTLKKHIGRAEALLIAEYWRTQVKGLENAKTPPK
jgi:hypothetical protein